MYLLFFSSRNWLKYIIIISWEIHVAFLLLVPNYIKYTSVFDTSASTLSLSFIHLICLNNVVHWKFWRKNRSVSYAFSYIKMSHVFMNSFNTYLSSWKRQLKSCNTWKQFWILEDIHESHVIPKNNYEFMKTFMEMKSCNT